MLESHHPRQPAGVRRLIAVGDEQSHHERITALEQRMAELEEKLKHVAKSAETELTKTSTDGPDPAEWTKSAHT
jgi:hypothetical protein